MDDDTDLIGSTEAMTILKRDRATLSRWVKTGKLTPAQKLSGKTGAYLFRRSDIERLAAGRAS